MITDRLIDEFTGLPRYQQFDVDLQAARVRADQGRVPLSVILFDVDWFARVNHHDGHERGDQVLLAVADLLKSRATEEVCVYRVGGDEFAVLTRVGLLAAVQFNSRMSSQKFSRATTGTPSAAVWPLLRRKANGPCCS